MTKLVIYDESSSIPQDALDLIQELVPPTSIQITKDLQLLQSSLNQAEIAAGRIPFEMILKSSCLKWYQHMGAGVDFLMKFKQQELNSLLLTNASGAAAIQISEHCIALLLSLTRKINNCARNQAQKKWKKLLPEFQNELYGKRVLLCGYGAIGSRVANILNSFGTTIDVIRNDVTKETFHARRVGTLKNLGDFIQTADIIILTNQLTPKTYHCIDFEEFQKMKAHAILINIARGKLINEKALVEVCKNDKIAGAGLDVFESEPLPKNSPLWEMDNILITPHIAGLSMNSSIRSYAIFAENLQCYLNGNPMQNVIDTSFYTSDMAFH